MGNINNKNYGPTKRHKLEKGTLFDLLPMDIINDIDYWIIGLEHNDKLQTIVTRIKIPRNPVLRMCSHTHWMAYLLF